MSKAKALVIPDTHVLRGLMEEYQDMLREAAEGIKRVLALTPDKEKFWDSLTDLHPLVTMLEARSNSIAEEIEDLVDQLPED